MSSVSSPFTYLRCDGCGDRLPEPWPRPSSGRYTVPYTHHRPKARRGCRLLVRVTADGTAGTRELPHNVSYEQALKRVAQESDAG